MLTEDGLRTSAARIQLLRLPDALPRSDGWSEERMRHRASRWRIRLGLEMPSTRRTRMQRAGLSLRRWFGL